jgi:TetR/AcrR family transcriptional regulator, transcriptional repressor of bet genes
LSAKSESERAGPGRPSTGAKERILGAALETLLADGYAGLTTAKVAVRAGESKALIAYHFGSKQGLVAAAARNLGELITEEIVQGLQQADTLEAVVRGAVSGVWRIVQRDVRLARSYFDLNAVSVVEDDVRAALREVKDRWREVLAAYLRDTGVPARRIPSATVLLMAGLEGLALEWIERGSTPELEAARGLFERSVVAAVAE